MPPKTIPKTPGALPPSEVQGSSSSKNSYNTANAGRNKKRKNEKDLFGSDNSDSSEGETSDDSQEEESFNYKQAVEKQTASKGDLNRLWEGMTITELGVFRQIHQALKNIPAMLGKTEKDGAVVLKEYLTKINLLQEDVELHVNHVESNKADKNEVYFFMVTVNRTLKSLSTKLAISGESKGTVGLLKIMFNSKQLKALMGRSTCAEMVHGFSMLKSNSKFYSATSAQLHSWRSQNSFNQNGQKNQNQSNSKKAGNSKGSNKQKDSTKPMWAAKKFKKEDD